MYFIIVRSINDPRQALACLNTGKSCLSAPATPPKVQSHCQHIFINAAQEFMFSALPSFMFKFFGATKGAWSKATAQIKPSDPNTGES